MEPTRRANLIVIFGPAAVGKMTVGLELQRLTGLRLFHNHMAVDLALQFFPFGSPQFLRLVAATRRHVFEEVASSDLPGLIFTYVWALNEARDKAAVDDLVRIFSDLGASVGYVVTSSIQIDISRSTTRIWSQPRSRSRSWRRSRSPA